MAFVLTIFLRIMLARSSHGGSSFCSKPLRQSLLMWKLDSLIACFIWKLRVSNVEIPYSFYDYLIYWKIQINCIMLQKCYFTWIKHAATFLDRDTLKLVLFPVMFLFLLFLNCNIIAWLKMCAHSKLHHAEDLTYPILPQGKDSLDTNCIVSVLSPCATDGHIKILGQL